jgi:uncharacterized GH25 family protein
MPRRVFTSALVVLCLVGAAVAGAQKTGTLKGKIEGEKGKPIAGAQVRVMSSRDRSVKEAATDNAGEYSFELEPDDYSVSFDAEGYQGGTMVQMQQVEAGKETRVKTIKLPKASRTSLIRGAVFDAGGLSIAGARVKLVRVATDEEAKERKKIESFSRDYTTNSKGEFAFRLPSKRARYQLTAMHGGYKSETKTVDVSEGEAAPVAFNLEPLKK